MGGAGAAADAAAAVAATATATATAAAPGWRMAGGGWQVVVGGWWDCIYSFMPRSLAVGPFSSCKVRRWTDPGANTGLSLSLSFGRR
ncbi:hypothetical protein LZ31DRAFT_393838 [Colletotrichum somersetense]|nr:hypothetical protein LZ31DRAFT_393838 [Colletotrichum somersetense]